MPITQFPANVDVSTLNGDNGFAVDAGDGEYSVSSAGDINDDGIADFVIGAPYAFNGAGAGYVIFGGKGLGGSGVLSTTNLIGSNGFTITFPKNNYGGGSTVSGGGDINNDGIDDLLITAGGHGGIPKVPSAVYVFFGHSGIGASGVVSVSSLNGSNGFNISAPYPYPQISEIGDVNGDRIDDFVIGFDDSVIGYYPASAFVIFGKDGIGSLGTFNLTSLNGVNGFSIIVPTSIYSGCLGLKSIYIIGDINDDGICDLGIGQVCATGYIIFGHIGIGSSGTLSVTSLTGSNGFAIPPQVEVVNGIGDINNDGIVDFAVCGFVGVGVDYVIFGKVGIGSSGNINLGGLTGSNGFTIGGCSQKADDINGDGVGDFAIITGSTTISVVFGSPEIGLSGNFDLATLTGGNGFTITNINGIEAINTVGDINDDGITDLVIGVNILSGIGGYVIFGDIFINLINNRLTVEKGHTVIINSANLNATSFRFQNRNQGLIFSITNSLHGHFENVNNPGVPINSFSQQQIWSAQIKFVHDGSVFAPSYGISVGDGKLTGFFPPQPANITFIHLGPKLIKNILAINQGQTLTLSTNQLQAVDQDYLINYPSLVFTMSGVRNGQFHFTVYPSVTITTFTQAQTGSVQFSHDGSVNPPAYNVQVSDGVGGITTLPQAATVFFNLPPVLVNNTLSINQGQTVILTSSDFSATDPDDPLSSLIFLASNIQFGHFELVSNPGTVITDFIQGLVQSTNVQFIPDGSANPPSFSMAVSDGKATTLSQMTTITFNLLPHLVNNALNVKQGKTVILTTENLSASDPEISASSLLFIVSNVSHGHFGLINNPGVTVTSFSQTQIQNAQVLFVPDGSSQAPSYRIAVSDGKVATTSQAALITFDAAPVLINNQLSLTQAQSVTVTPSDLSASDDQISASNLVFIVSGISHGHFEDSSNPGVALTQFSQQKIFNGALRFVTDASVYPPIFNTSVSDGILSTLPAAAIINFSLSAAAITSNDTVHNAIIGGAVSGAIGILFLVTKLAISYKANQYLNRVLNTYGADEEKEQKFQQKVISPLVKKIFDEIKTTGFMGYRSEQSTKDYVTAIEHIVGYLGDHNINLNLETLSPKRQIRIFNEITRQVREILIPEYDRCSTAYLCRFFKAEVSPQQIEDHAKEIAGATVMALRTNNKSNSKDIELFKIDSLGDRVQRMKRHQAHLSQRVQGLVQRLDEIEKLCGDETSLTFKGIEA